MAFNGKLIAAYPQLLKDKYAVDFEAGAPVQDVLKNCRKPRLPEKRRAA